MISFAFNFYFKANESFDKTDDSLIETLPEPS